MKTTKRMKFLIVALMAGVMSLSCVPFAEAGVKLDDLQILLRWKDDRKPPEPPAPAPMERHEAHGPQWAPQPDAPAPHGHDQRRVHAPQDFRGPKHSFHGEPPRPVGPGREVPPPQPPMPHRPLR